MNSLKSHVFDAMVFSGNSNLEFSKNVVKNLGIELGDAKVLKFADGENYVEICASVRGQEVYVIQSTCPKNPANNLMELLIMIDALKRASASTIIAVIPYFGYARQDRRPYSARVPITAKLVANMLTVAGANRIVTVDLHADQIQGFFDIPVDNLYASKVFTLDIKEKYNNAVIVSPDVGGVVRARAIAKILNTDLAIVDKRRPKANTSEVMNIIGEVKGRDCIIVDDIVDTAGTLCKAAIGLKDFGANNIIAYCTHPIFSEIAINNIESSVLAEIVVSDTIPLAAKARKKDKIRQISIAEMVAESIRRIHLAESVSTLFPN